MVERQSFWLVFAIKKSNYNHDLDNDSVRFSWFFSVFLNDSWYNEVNRG